jgi:ABC-type dipeptide/oligopeptide/nickel transport system permease subunit
MIRSGWALRRSDPMLTVYPALLLAATIMAFNFLGDALRDWLDPRSRAA